MVSISPRSRKGFRRLLRNFLFILGRDLGFRLTSSDVIKYLFGFSALTAHDVMNQSIMIVLLN